MNPYADQIVPDPESRPAITVRSYNLDAFEALQQKISDGLVSKQNQTRASVLVSTDPGYGKTHLLTRILDAVGPRCLPVFVPPVNAGSQLSRSVNHRVVSRLWRMIEGGRSVNQFEWLALQLIAKSCASHDAQVADAWARFPVEQLDHEETQAHLTDQREELVRWLAPYLEGQSLQEPHLAWAAALLDILSADIFAETRATEWIKGRLAGYPGLVSDAEGECSAPPEEGARAEARLFDLLRLFGLVRPVLFVFDQIENFESFGKEAVQGLFHLIERILVESQQTQVLVAANAPDWHGFLERCGVAKSFQDRFHRPEVLRPLTFDEACELRDRRAGESGLAEARRRISEGLIRRKLDPAPSGEARTSFGSPRRFLEVCADCWDGKQPSETEPRKIDFSHEYEKALSLARREGIGFYPENLRTYLEEVYGATVQKRAGYEFWKVGKRLYFAEPGAHHMRWEAWARRALELAAGGQVVALRPGRDLSRLEHLAYTPVPKPTWQRVPLLEQFLNGPGRIRELEPRDMLEVLGACRFLDASADIGVSRPEAAAWLKRERRWKPPEPPEKGTSPAGPLTAQEQPTGAKSGVVQLSVHKLVSLLQRKGAKLPAGPALPMRERGILFHELACRFVQHLIENEPIDASAADALQAFLERERLWNGAQKYDVEQPRLSDALRALAMRIDTLRKEAGTLRSWQELYVATELQVHQVLGVYNRVTVLLTGRCDVLRRRRPGGEPEIVDYKLSSLGDTPVENQLQLALYAKLLSEGANPMSCRGTLEIYSPELSEVHFSHYELLQFFQKEVEPALRRMTREALTEYPEIQEIALDASTAAVESSEPEKALVPARYEPVSADPAAQVGEPHGDDLSQRIEEAFASYKLKVKVSGRMEAPQLVRYLVRPAPGVKVTSLASRGEDLQVMLGLATAPSVFAGAGFVRLDIGKERPDLVAWEDLEGRPEMKRHPGSLAFPAGVGVDGEVIIGDFCDSNMAHALVAGASGSGKSEFLKALVASLLVRNREGTLSLSVIDPKVLTFAALEGCPALSEPVISEIGRAMQCLREVADGMDRRYRILRNEGYENLAQRFAAGKTNLPYRVVVFDEFADLILASREARKEFEVRAARIAAKGRAAGIHLVLATQRPDREVVTGLLKANLPMKVCFRVVNAANSQIVLGASGAETLLGRGDFLCDLGNGMTRGQSPFLEREKLAKIATGR